MTIREIVEVAPILVGGDGLTLHDVVRVARGMAPVALDPACIERIRESRRYIEEVVAEGRVVYGVTTGFGALKDRRIPPHAVEDLQINLIRSHCAGVGPLLPRDAVRGMLLLRANALCKGVSGVRLETVQLLVDLLNHRIHPQIPSQGSVGSSGDLAPLSHMALTLIGEGMVERGSEVVPAAKALAEAGLQPVRLGAKEGLALINGTQCMTSVGCLALHDALLLAKAADIACATTLDATMGSPRAYIPEFHALRPHPGQLAAARNLTRLTQESEIFASHADCDRVQDCYSLRCAPQVHGASRDAFAHVQRVLEIEINSATDNPLILADTGEVLTGGHFHGQPVALVMDFLKIGLCELASVSERRTERLVNPQHSNGLPAFLTPDGGLNSGYMLAQYTAASLVSENKVLAHPASVDSIPTGAGQEDHNSMGTIAARQAAEIARNCRHVLAIEIMCAAAGIDHRLPLRPSAGARAAHAAVRSVVDSLDGDRPITADIEAVAGILLNGDLVAAVEAAVGPLD